MNNKNEKKYDEYVLFVIGADLANKQLYNEYDFTDVVFEKCKRLAVKFEKSDYNKLNKDLYGCIEEFLKDEGVI